MTLPSTPTPAAPAALIKDASTRSFAADVMQDSMNQPVIVDFWAPWCGPCKQLTPVLERVVTAAKGAVKLVKINIDENPEVARQFRIQSIPAVYAFRNGQPVDGFLGAMPESQVKQFVGRLAEMAGGVADEAAEIVAAAKEALAEGNLGGAAEAFAAVLQMEPGRADALAGLARVYLQGGQTDEARAILAEASEEARTHEDMKAVEAALAMADKAAAAGPLEPLRAAVEADPGDHQKRFDYAVALAGAGQHETAIDELLVIVKRDRNWEEQKARTELLTLFEALGPADPLVMAGRRKLSAILFS